MAMADNTRKRKQEFVEPKPINTSWSDFVYSSPSSPQQQQAQTQDFSLDTIFQHHYQPPSVPTSTSGTEQQHRRHSVAVGEMQYHSIDKMNYWNTNQEFEQLINNTGQHSLPSSWSSSSSVTVDGPMMHRRAMSLRLDNLPIHQHQHHQHQQQEDIYHRNNSISTTSPTTPAFFSPSFLDALKHDEDHNQTYSDDIIHDFMFNQQQQQQQQSTITPSVINGNDQVNNLTNWLLNQPVSPSSTSSHSPSNNNLTFQQQHPSIPEEEDDHIIKEEEIEVNTETDQHNMNCTVLKPLVQKYLFTFENEKTITILTSKVAQKSYGTEKR